MKKVFFLENKANQEVGASEDSNNAYLCEWTWTDLTLFSPMQLPLQELKKIMQVLPREHPK